MSKQQVLAEVDEAYDELNQAVQQIDDKAAGEKWYGDWNTGQILAHLRGWDQEMTQALKRVAASERPTPEGVDYSDADAWNAKFTEALGGGSWQDAVAGWRSAHEALRSALEAVSDDRFEEGKTAYRIAHATVIDHYKEHGAAISAWRG
ncbi:MAG: ClbS/DfsB family four-helix bundle protein [Dehalococcoidia bacterium]